MTTPYISCCRNVLWNAPDELIAQFKDPQTNQWVDVMAGEMLAQVRSVAKGLMAIGARPGTMVAIYSATSYEWGVMDFACASMVR